jgi:release factor glutamine methyltransferase
MKSIAQALNVQERTISRRDAEIFLQHALNKPLSYLLAHPEDTLTPLQTEQFEGFVARRELNEPVAYITGNKEFYGRPFLCDKRALIPRPETEGIIDRSMAFLPMLFKSHLSTNNKPCPLHVLELGTGCGNIAVTLGLELQQANVPATIIATDVAAEALELALQNWQELSTSETPLIKLDFLQADMFDAAEIRTLAPYDLIVANLPYVPTTWKFDPAAQPEVVFREPDVALFGGEDGLDLYRSFFEEVAQYLKDDGYILIEYGEDETPAITELARAAFPKRSITTYQDYAQLDRILEII